MTIVPEYEPGAPIQGAASLHSLKHDDVHPPAEHIEIPTDGVPIVIRDAPL
jgi:hypothetical protein